MSIYFCVHCNSEIVDKTSQVRKFCSKKCKGKYYQYNSYICQQTRAHKRKKLIVEKFGGKCESCGYNKNLAALSFHHKNPSEKSFPLDMRNLSNKTMESIELELSKCSLLCLNCHAEHHNPKHNNMKLEL